LSNGPVEISTGILLAVQQNGILQARIAT